MASTRAPARSHELLLGLAAQLDAGVTPSAALAGLAAAGPAAARTARRIEEHLAGHTLASALAEVGLVDAQEAAVLAIGEEHSGFARALSWALERRAMRRTRRRALLGAVLGPLAFIALSLLSEPLPQIAIGGLSWWVALRAPILRIAGGAFALFALPWILVRAGLGPGVRELGARVPLARALLHHDNEHRLAAMIAAFAEPRGLGAAVSAAPVVVPARLAEGLVAAAADPQLRSTIYSEALELVLIVGARVGDLPNRAHAYYLAEHARLTARLRLLARIVAFGAAAIVAIHGALSLLSTPIGLGAGTSSTPEMKELERELENLTR